MTIAGRCRERLAQPQACYRYGRRMLEDTNIPLQRVAAACGFGNVKAMRRALLRREPARTNIAGSFDIGSILLGQIQPSTAVTSASDPAPLLKSGPTSGLMPKVGIGFRKNLERNDDSKMSHPGPSVASARESVGRIRCGWAFVPSAASAR